MERAKRIHEQIDKLNSPDAAEAAPGPAQSPRDFIQQRMRELKNKEQ